MRILVTYESVRGTTRQVAEAVVAGMCAVAPKALVRCVQVGRLPGELPDADLLVVGGPSDLFGLPGAGTRRRWVGGVVEASRRGSTAGHRPLEPGGAGPGLREWFSELPEALATGEADLLRGRRPGGAASRPWAAAFDTRPGGLLTIGAARPIARALRRHGYGIVVPPEGFVVTQLGGPLRPGELDRARHWGGALAALVAPAVPG